MRLEYRGKVMGEACIFSALLRAYVPCDVQIGLEGCMTDFNFLEGCVTVFNFLVVFHRE
jgi:hypothetical protein